MIEKSLKKSHSEEVKHSCISQKIFYQLINILLFRRNSTTEHILLTSKQTKAYLIHILQSQLNSKSNWTQILFLYTMFKMHSIYKSMNTNFDKFEMFLIAFYCWLCKYFYLKLKYEFHSIKFNKDFEINVLNWIKNIKFYTSWWHLVSHLYFNSI